jgi:hypothetical protein
MEQINLFRFFGNKYCMMGAMSFLGHETPLLYTIEKPWLNNQQMISCIPSGSYVMEPKHKENFGSYPDVWQILDVPNRYGIYFHVANRAEQLKGCIATGLLAGSSGYEDPNIGKGNAVLDSKSAMNFIKETIGYKRCKLLIIGDQHA